MKPTAVSSSKPLRLAVQTVRALQSVQQLRKEPPMSTTLTPCAGGCKANSRICSL